MSRVYNFAAGPAVLPLEVLQEAQKELVDYIAVIKEEHAKKQTEGDDRLLEVLSRKRERKG